MIYRIAGYLIGFFSILQIMMFAEIGWHILKKIPDWMIKFHSIEFKDEK